MGLLPESVLPLSVAHGAPVPFGPSTAAPFSTGEVPSRDPTRLATWWCGQRGHTGNRRGCCCPRPVSAYGAELAQPWQEVDGLPVLGEPAAGDAVEVDRGDRDGPAGGRHAGEHAAVGAPCPPAGRDLVPLGDLVQHGDGKVGEGPPGGQHRVAVGAGADAAAVGQPAPEVGREQVVERRDVAVGEDLFVVAATSALCSAWVMSPPSPAAYTIVEVMMVRVT